MEQGDIRTSRIEFIFAVIAALAGVWFIIDAGSIRLGSGYDRIGPRFFPYVIGTGLLLSGALTALATWRQRFMTLEDPTEYRPFLILLGGLLLSVMVLNHLGFILTMTVLFMVVAHAFGSRRLFVDIPIALLLAAVVYIVFTRGLGLSLPAGILPG